MPYQWNDETPTAPVLSGQSHSASGRPLAKLTLWPHRSLPARGFVITIGLLFGFGLLPMIPLLGTPLIWAILAFTLAALAALWVALQVSYRRGLGEELLFWNDLIRLTRTNPNGATQTWEANPYWTKIDIHAEGGPVEDYLTLRGDGRTVELGAFLTPEERRQLRSDLAFVLGQIGQQAR